MKHTQLTPLGIVALVGVGIFLGALASTGNPHIAWPSVFLAYLAYVDGKTDKHGTYGRKKDAFWWEPMNVPTSVKTVADADDDDAVG